MKKSRPQIQAATKTRYTSITTLFDLDMHGDESSREFLAVLNRSQRVIFQICLYFTDCQPASICDLYQEIACTLWEAWPTFRGQSATDTWVRRVALNVAVSEVRHSSRQPHFVPLEEWIYDTIAEEVAVAPPDYYRLIAALGPDERALLYLRLDRLPLRDIADIYGTSEAAIKQRLYRLRQKLNSLKQQDNETF